MIVHYQAPEWCRATVESLLDSEGVDVAVTVVNNGGHVVLPRSVDVIDPGSNLGFAEAANLGLDRRRKDADVVLVGCHDALYEPDALAEIVRLLRADAELGIAGPVLDGAGSTERDLEWISGTTMVMRAEIADRFRFDARWGSYVEDVDFCYRVRDAGWRVGRAGDAHVATRGSVDADLAKRLTGANSLVFFLRRRMWRRATSRSLHLLRERQFRALSLSARQLVRFAISKTHRP